MDDDGAVLLSEGVYRIGGPISVPRILSRPELPKSDIIGSVQLRAVINADGLPKVVEVVEASDDRLTPLAIDCVVKWRFRPAYRRRLPQRTTPQGIGSPSTFNDEETGQPVAVGATFELHFR